MAYELLSDVETVVLGGKNKETGKKNPTSLEGYFLRVEHRPNKFNPKVPQNYYVFQTSTGDKGLFGKAGVDREMKKAILGAMTKVVNTEKTLDTGKGNPMIVFEVYQDKSNSIEVAEQDSTDTPPSVESAHEAVDDALDEDDDEELDVVAAPMPSKPARPVQVNAERAAKVQALMNRR